MKKAYSRPSISLLTFTQKESLAACGAWISGLMGSGCADTHYEDQGMAACDPNMPYDK